MDSYTVTLALIGVVLLTALLIAVYLVVPRVMRRGGAMTAAAAAAVPGRMETSRLDRPPVGTAVMPSGPRASLLRDDPRPAGDVAAGTDELTGLMTASGWGRVVADEDARVRRYRRPATIVMIELDGLDRLVDRLGDASADRLVPAVTETIRRMAREADHVARLGRGRFGVLLPETDEIQAINYIERIRRACDLWLESGAVALRLAIGWASASGDDNLHDAGRTATERMFAEIHRNARRAGDLVLPSDELAAGNGAPESRRA